MRNIILGLLGVFIGCLVAYMVSIPVELITWGHLPWVKGIIYIFFVVGGAWIGLNWEKQGKNKKDNDK